MTVEIPDTLAFATRMTETDIKRELAIALFQQAKLTLGSAAALASMPQPEFQMLLGSRVIAPHYDMEEFTRDIEGLRRRGVL